jgi:23S rRNA pseudouridine1911/1915/1917 synthase
VNDPLVILHEDAHCLAVVKPPGQFTQGEWAPPDEITLETAVRRYLDPADPGAVYLGIVHRLDRPTSGLLIWAKTPKAARRLASQFELRRVFKEYWAVVESGTSSAVHEAGRRDENWTDWLTRPDRSGIVSAALPHATGAREAITAVRFEEAELLPPQCRWLRLWPQTGRTHQLRVQAARRGWPILGDRIYGSTASAVLSRGIALHARALAFDHPSSGSPMRLVAPVPSTWKQAGIVLAEPLFADSLESVPQRPAG